MNKNPFLSNLSFFDRIYPVFVSLPGFLRRKSAAWISEYTNSRVRNRNVPDRLTLFVTDRCNLRCRHCFVSTSERQKTWEMGIREYEEFFNKAKGLFSQVLFTGGEPTLRDGLGDILVTASERGKIPSSTIFTNGLLVERLIKAVQKVLLKTCMKLSFQLSIDGTSSLHDENRGVKGAFDKTIEAMNILKALKEKYPDRILRLIAATSISRSNLPELSSIIDVVRPTGFSHVFSFVRSSKKHVFNVSDENLISDFSPVGFDEYLTVEDMEKALRLIYEELWKYNALSLPHATNRVILKTIAESLKTGKCKAFCYSGIVDVVILPNGDVARCEMLKGFANLKDFNWDFAELMRSQQALEHYNHTRGCWCTHDCSVGLSIMHDTRLLTELFAKPQPKLTSPKSKIS